MAAVRRGMTLLRFFIRMRDTSMDHGEGMRDTSMSHDEAILRTMIEATEEAGKVISARRAALSVWQKDPNRIKGVVTDADIAADEVIADRLSRDFPDFALVSEEVRPDGIVSDDCFVVDPIDGTINFMNGLPLWGTQIACVRGGRTVASVINLHDLGRVYTANDEGAYLNGEPIHVSDIALSQGGIYTIEGFDRLLGRREMIDEGCLNLREHFASCTSFAFTAAGNLAASVYLEGFPWDWMPGELLVRRAGGVSFVDEENDIHIVANTQENLEIMKSVFCRLREARI